MKNFDKKNVTEKKTLRELCKKILKGKSFSNLYKITK